MISFAEMAKDRTVWLNNGFLTSTMEIEGVVTAEEGRGRLIQVARESIALVQRGVVE